MTSTIPIIDIGPYLDGSDKQSVARQIGEACETIGFFMITGHGIETQLLQDIQAASTEFFDLDLSTKQKTVAPFGLGYMGSGVENVAATLDETSSIRDDKESLNLVLPVSEQVWPKQPPQLTSLCQDYYTQMLDLASKLMRLFALALDLEETWFDDKVNQPYTTLRLLNYPAVAVEDEKENQEELNAMIRNAEHTDYGTLTILWSPDSRGLQAQSRNGVEWINVVSPSIDHFIINIGDLMMNWTNDQWISTLHRVVPHVETRGQRRMSMPFFHNPNPTAMIECIQSCCGNEPAKYKPMLAKTHLEMKVSKALGKEETMDKVETSTS